MVSEVRGGGSLSETAYADPPRHIGGGYARDESEGWVQGVSRIPKGPQDEGRRRAATQGNQGEPVQEGKVRGKRVKWLRRAYGPTINEIHQRTRLSPRALFRQVKKAWNQSTPAEREYIFQSFK